MKLLTRMAWRNLARNPRRTGITIAGLALGLALSISTWVLFDGFLQDSVNALVSSDGHVLVQHPGQVEQKNFYDIVEDSDALMAELEAMPEVASVEPRVDAAGLLSGDTIAAGASIVAVDLPRDTSRRRKQVVEGTWLEGPGQAVLGTGLAKRIEVVVGDEVAVLSQGADGSLANTLWTVVGLVETGNADMDRTTSWVEMGEARELFVLDGVHALAVRLHDAQGARSFAAALAGRDRFTTVAADLGQDAAEGSDPFRTPLDEAPIVVRSWKSVNPLIAQYAEMSQTWSLVTVLIVLVTAALGAMNTMLMSVLERTRELGVLMATGMRPPQIVGLIVLENLAMGIVATVFGLALGLIGGWLSVEVGFDLSSEGGGDLEFSGVSMEPIFRGAWSVEAFVWPTLLLGFVTFGGALFPAVRAALLKPVDAMRAGH